MTKQNRKFTGEGFSEETPKGKEYAVGRERAKFFDDNFLTPDEFLEQTGLAWLSRIAIGFPAFFRAFTVVGAIGAAVIVLQEWGLL